jgi:hypothetical protein
MGEVAVGKLTSPGEPTNEQYYMPEDQGEDEIGSFASSADRNGNGGYILLRS